ncbi:MAG: DNA (cytosine-5-)-methyltransferase [Actinomycetota bacterium]|nr:DNA (cytosine-5-)-methyltransferase [Actinomycetota bacterium]
MAYRSPKYHEPNEGEIAGTVTELFAGVGGFRIALARDGWKTVFSNQWEPSTKSQHASDCYVHHFGAEGHSNENLTRVVERHLEEGTVVPRTDLIVGGFPCQDYSVAKSLKHSHGLEGKKGVLWWDIQKLIEVNRPRFIFLENVDRLLKSPSTQRGRDFAVMLNTLGLLGYLIEWRVVNAADYGFPQRRIRVFIVASRLDLLPSSMALDPEELLRKSGILARALPIKKSSFRPRLISLVETPDVISATFGKGNSRSPFENSGVFFEGVAYTLKVQSRYSGRPKTLGEVLEDGPFDSEYVIPADRLPEWRYLKGAKSIERTHKESGFTYSYAEGKMSFPDSLDKPSRTILTGEGGTSPSRFKHVIKDGSRYRRLTPIELERLNGFPDNWTQSSISGPLKPGRRAFFMGNALVVGLVERVGRVLASEMRSQGAI